MKIEVQLINAFVDGAEGGNLAGVLVDADFLTSEQKFEIARQVGVSETAFVSASSVADFKLDFFTPARQIAHCGHATIAAFAYLHQHGKVKSSGSSKETIDGIRAIYLKDGLAYMEQSKPSFHGLSQAEEKTVLTSLGIEHKDLLPHAKPMLVNTGNSFIVVPLRSKAVLKQLKPDHLLIEQISEAKELVGLYPFSLETEKPGRDAGARMFAPRYGIEEEAATGMAAGPLACYLHAVLGIRKIKFLIEQGYLMGTPAPSLLTVELVKEAEEITSLLVGGKGRMKETIMVEVAS